LFNIFKTILSQNFINITGCVFWVIRINAKPFEHAVNSAVFFYHCINPYVNYAYIDAEASATSEDTCIVDVNRVESIEKTEIIWHITYELADTGESTEQTSSTVVIFEPKLGDLTIDGVVNIKDLARLAEKWLWTGEPGSILEDIVIDGYVDFLDFAELAENWKK